MREVPVILVTKKQFLDWLRLLPPEYVFHMGNNRGDNGTRCCGCPMVEYAIAHIPPGLDWSYISAGSRVARVIYSYYTEVLRFQFGKTGWWAADWWAADELNSNDTLGRLLKLEFDRKLIRPADVIREVNRCR